jgi:anti-sigma regulatory factor (Ser/Thr protein kinase)
MPVDADRDLPDAPAVTAAPPRKPAPPVAWWARELPGGQEQVRQARHWVEDLLPPCDPRADLALLASELCANAVLHTRSGQAGGRFTVDVEWTPATARVVIGDQGAPTAPAITARTADATWEGEHGRGLWLVDELADDWGTASRHGRRWTWADVRWQARGGPPLQLPGSSEDVSADIAGLRQAFPGATIWWGHQARAWQAAPSATSGASSAAVGASGLVSAPTSSGLRNALAAACSSSPSPAPQAAPLAAVVPLTTGGDRGR